MITENERAQRMIGDSPEYYEFSKVFNALQEANAQELDLVDQNNEDIALQLRPTTATWGLKFWEERLD
ncbi:putative phage tail protein [Bacillota bacterium Lsc_1132]